MNETQNPTFFPEERRKSPTDALVTLIHQVHESVQALDRKLDKGISSLREDAFPEGDADGHRRHHEAVIKAAEDRAKFWETMRVEIAKWGLIGFLGWALYNLWVSFLMGPHK